MKIYIIHGLAKGAISKKIVDLRKDFDSSFIFEINGKNSKEVLSEIKTPGLFAGKRLFIIEDINEEINLEGLRGDEDLDIIFKFSKTLNPKSPFLNSKIKNTQVLYFPEERDTAIFPFLDLLAAKNPKALAGLENLLEQYGSQYLFTMLFYSLRRFVLPAASKNEFQRRKIESLKKEYTHLKIENLYHEILQTDNKIKQGLLDEKLGVKGLILRIITS